MCIIALTTKGNLVSKEKLKNMTNRNSHGFGISWIKDGKIITFKSMDSKKFIEKAIDIQSEFYNDSEILIHCRLATSGKTNVANCHPFNIDDKTVFAHNGIFDDEVADNNHNTKSDTRIFNERFLRNLKPDFLKTKHMRNIIEELIGDHNKLAFLTVNNKLPKSSYIINKSKGIVEDGVWYSNSGYKFQVVYSTNWNRAWQIPDDDYCAIGTSNVNVASDELLIQNLEELEAFVQNDSEYEIICERDPDLGTEIDDQKIMNGEIMYDYTDVMAFDIETYANLYMHIWGELPIMKVKHKKQMKLSLKDK